MILSGFLFNSKNYWEMWLPHETLRDEWRDSVAVYRQESEIDEREGQPSGSEIRFLRSQWRARPLSSISEISSVVRIRPHHLFLSHYSACFIGPSQEAMRSFVANILHVLHLYCSSLAICLVLWNFYTRNFLKNIKSDIWKSCIHSHNKKPWMDITKPSNLRQVEV